MIERVKGEGEKKQSGRKAFDIKNRTLPDARPRLKYAREGEYVAREDESSADAFSESSFEKPRECNPRSSLRKA